MNTRALSDSAAREAALKDHDRTLLVEAGAGSGKTAVLAGRIVLMLADGVTPSAIAAVTFTELAASELQARVQDMLGELRAGRVPVELRLALPTGLSTAQQQTLAAAAENLDDFTCTTIHGFCQRLITPYPVEANIDPGAAIMDPGQVELVFGELVDDWLRELLSSPDASLVGELVFHEPAKAIQLIQSIARALRKHPGAIAPQPTPLAPLVAAFRAASQALSDFIQTTPVQEAGTVIFARRFGELAEAVTFALAAEDPATLVRLLATRPHADLCTATGGFLQYRRKGKWVDAAKSGGLSKADGERFNLQAEATHRACCEAWRDLLESAAARVLHDLMMSVSQIVVRFQAHKRQSALLDFDDLIHAARDLLRQHPDVREALANRFQRVLVDEFQDTDSAQCEIFWRLGSDGPIDGAWADAPLRPGALFLVGDPKQAIYRFRGADVASYLHARTAIGAATPENVLSIATNFRSCASILTFVNARFALPLAADGQPGFTPLNAFYPDPDEALCLAALDVAVADENGKATPDRQRDGEAEAVADLCARLIGSQGVLDHRTGETRPCRPGDIALLAPTGADLWRYEEALERRGVPVATQAGKGFFRRQEVQDLIAVTRVLADSRDTVALAALLRGPLVGLSEEELLDLVWTAPRPAESQDALPRLSLHLPLADTGHPLAREIFERLAALRRSINSTTPHDLISQAVDVLRVRPLLMQRHPRQAERALANVDAFLALAVTYDVRGLRAFARMLTAAWEDETRAVEGRPDAQEESTALYTMHAAKGLEWPIVIPINTMTRTKAGDSAILDRQSSLFLCPILGVSPTGYDTLRDYEKAELERERVRLWYVAATRARQLLILPRLDVTPTSSAWGALVDLSLGDLSAIDVSGHAPEAPQSEADPANPQTREVFTAQARTVLERTAKLAWRAPSRDEATAGSILLDEARQLHGDEDDGDPASAIALPQGGRQRGLVIHKLIEEILTGELAEVQAAIELRAAELVQALGAAPSNDAAAGLSPVEMAGSALRALAVPQVQSLRAGLMAELPVYRSSVSGDIEDVTTGVADALAVVTDGRPLVVIDWKSDIAPDDRAKAHYREQVAAYMDCVGAPHGFVVFVTSGEVLSLTA